MRIFIDENCLQHFKDLNFKWKIEIDFEIEQKGRLQVRFLTYPLTLDHQLVEKTNTKAQNQLLANKFRMNHNLQFLQQDPNLQPLSHYIVEQIIYAHRKIVNLCVNLKSN